MSLPIDNTIQDIIATQNMDSYEKYMDIICDHEETISQLDEQIERLALEFDIAKHNRNDLTQTENDRINKILLSFYGDVLSKKIKISHEIIKYAKLTKTYNDEHKYYDNNIVMNDIITEYQQWLKSIDVSN